MLPVIYRHPVTVNFGGTIRTARMKWGSFVLGRGSRPKHLGRPSLIEAASYAAAVCCLEDTGCPQSGYVACELGHIKTDTDMTLRPQVIDLVRLNAVDEIGELSRVERSP